MTGRLFAALAKATKRSHGVWSTGVRQHDVGLCYRQLVGCAGSPLEVEFLPRKRELGTLAECLAWRPLFVGVGRSLCLRDG